MEIRLQILQPVKLRRLQHDPPVQGNKMEVRVYNKGVSSIYQYCFSMYKCMSGHSETCNNRELIKIQYIVIANVSEYILFIMNVANF